MNRGHKILALGAVALSVIAGVAIAAPTQKVTRTVYRTPVACTRAALAAVQAQADWLTIDAAHDVADQAALSHATYRQYRNLLLHIPARPKTVDLGACGR